MNRVPVFRKRAGPDVVFSKNLQACPLLIQLPETKDHLDLDFGQPGRLLDVDITDETKYFVAEINISSIETILDVQDLCTPTSWFKKV